MADPVGIVGTALGVVSLGLQVYNNLKTYVDDFKNRDEHVTKVSRQLDLLHGSLNIIKTAIPAIEDNFRTESAVVVSGLQASEASLKSLAKELQKHGFTPATNFKGKAMEFKKRLKYPFAVPELDKLARDIDRINSHLLVALQGLGLNIQSATANSLADVKNTAQTTAADIASVIGKLDSSAANNTAFQESLTKQIRETSIPRAESLEAISLVRRIENSTSSTTTHLTDLVSDHQLHRRQTGKLEERISELRDIIVQQSQRESPAEQFFHMLMSKPDYMRSWQDAMKSNGQGPRGGTWSPEPVDDPIFGLTRARHGKVSYACGCRHRRRQTRSRTSWSTFAFFDETIVRTKHEPGCPKYSKRQATRERTVGITYTGLHRLLHTAVAVSLRQVRGAGGTSISPMFRYYATVDVCRSPAFRIVGGISVAIDSFYCSSKRQLPTSECEARAKQILYYGVSKLRRVFEDRLSSPTDLDGDGATLLAHVFHQPIVYFGYHGGIDALQCLGDLILALLELDVPRESTASHMPETSLPFLRVLGDDRGELRSEEEQAYFKEELLPLLFPEDPSDQILPARGVYWLSPVFRDLLTKPRHVVEALDLDSPLFIALLTKDENMLRRALQIQAADVDEPTGSGITAVHIATLWPRGLEIVLKSCPGIDLNIKSNGYSPLGLAMVICADTCIDPSRGCIDCPCAESVELLLEYGCFLSEDDIFLGLHNLDTPRIAHVLLDHIRRWRTKLTEIAYIYLSSKERESFGITQDNVVLDSVAPDVIRKLESHGISPSDILKLHPGDYRLAPPIGQRSGCSIYCELNHLKTAEQAFALGFKDFDFPHSNGETTLSELARLHVDSRNIPFVRFIVYCYWLIDHGASLAKPMQWQWDTSPSEFLYPDEVPQHIIAHCLMTSPRLRSSFTRLPPRGGATQKGVARFNIMFQCHSLDIADGCRCACSENEGGCEPLTTFLTSFQRFGESLEPIAGDFEKFYGHKYNKTELLRFSFALLRCVTFQELEIRHTCCNTLWREHGEQVFGEPGPDYGEDFPYIRDEDEPLLAKLEELVTEFKEKFRTGCDSLPEFLKGYWRERMDQVKNEMQSRRLTQEERHGILALGVEKWQEEAESHIVDVPTPVKGEADLGPTDVLFWIRRLDSISS